mmetsp:Transcript_12598/g.35990  ORF Transcript_12598/g.35990 Transcript_12598/m.35990 type:complete len:228 (-) Transcript_12598:7-690(-)
MGSPRPLFLDWHDVCNAARSLDLLLCRGTVRRSVHGDRTGQLASSQDLEGELILATTQIQNSTLLQHLQRNLAALAGEFVEVAHIDSHVVWKTVTHASRDSSQLGQLSVQRRLSTLKSRADATSRTALLSTHSVSRCASLSSPVSPSLPRLLASRTLLGAQIVQSQPLSLVLRDTLHHGHPCSPRRLHASLDPHANIRRGLDPVNSDDALHRTTVMRYVSLLFRRRY